MELKTWEEAETAGTEYAELTSQLELLKEELREFCARRHDAVGKARLLGPVLVGFRQEAATVIVEDEPLAISALKGVVGIHEFGRLVKQVEELDRPRLKVYFRAASEAVRGELLEIGITLRAATEKFYVKLRNATDKEPLRPRRLRGATVDRRGAEKNTISDER